MNPAPASPTRAGPRGTLLHVRTFLVAVLAISVSLRPAMAVASALPPPADPAGLTTATTDGGLTVWVHPAPEPREGAPAEIGLWLVISAGTIYEEDDQLGAAYLAKDAAGQVLRAGPTEGLRARFRDDTGAWGKSDGLAHGALTHDAIVFTLVFDADDAAAWDAAVAHYRELLSGWSPGDEAIAAARGAAEARASTLSPEQRAFAAFMPDLFGDHRLGRREPIPPPDILDRTTPDAVRAFVASRYRVSGATLIAVGPGEPGELLTRVDRAMRALAADRLGRPTPPAVTRGIGGRVSVQGVENYRPGEVSLIAVEPATGIIGGRIPLVPADEAVLDAVAAELVSARVRPAAALAEPDTVSAEAGIKRWIGGVRVAEISVRVDEEALGNDALTTAGRAVGHEVARIARDGFTTQEIRDARAAVLVSADRSAAAWRDATAGAVMDALAAAAATPSSASGTPVWISPTEASAHASRVLASLTDRSLSIYTQGIFRPSALACVLISGCPADPPTTDQARAVLRAAREQAPPAGAVPERLAEIAAAGQVREIANEPITGVWSGVLANGVSVHTRRTTGDATETRRRGPGPAPGLIVRVSICDGLARETAGTAGRTRDAVGAWSYPRTDAADAGQLRAWAMRHGLGVRVIPGNAAVSLEITAPDADGLEPALELAGAMLANPSVDARLADRFPARARAIEARTGAGLRRLGELLFEPGDARARPAPIRERIDPAEADAWLARMAAAPLEIAVVGDVDPERAIEAAGRYLGGLPSRAAPSARRDRPWGAVPRVESVERVRVLPDDPNDRPGAVLGVVFADASDLDRLRPMVIAARAVEASYEDLLKGAGHAGRTQAWVWAGDGTPGRATLVVRYQGDADPDIALELAARAIDRVASGESDSAVIDAEIARARRSVARAWEQPSFWAEKLAKLASHGLGIESLSGMPAAYDSISPADVRAALAEAARDGLHKRVIVLPE